MDENSLVSKYGKYRKLRKEGMGVQDALKKTSGSITYAEEKVKTKIADVKKYDVDLSDLFEGEYVHHRFYITKEMEKQIHKYVIPELIRNGINNTDEFIAFQEENDLDWVDIFDVYGSSEIWGIKLPKKIKIGDKVIDIDKDFNSEEGGYLVYPNRGYIDKYTMIWDCWLKHPEDQIAIDLTFDWLENNKWGKFIENKS